MSDNPLHGFQTLCHSFCTSLPSENHHFLYDKDIDDIHLWFYSTIADISSVLQEMNLRYVDYFYPITITCLISSICEH